jgi:hypothetical protein
MQRFKTRQLPKMTYRASSNRSSSEIIAYKLLKLSYERSLKNIESCETSFCPCSEWPKNHNLYHTTPAATAPTTLRMGCRQWCHSCHQKSWAVPYPASSPPNGCSSAQRRRAVPRPTLPSPSPKEDPWLIRISIPQQLPSPLRTTSPLP